jgi:hypothetical protein
MADAPLVLGTFCFPRHPADCDVVLAASYCPRAGGDWRSRMPSVPKDVRRAFAVSSTAMVVAYTFGVLVLSLGGQVEHDLIGSPNAFLNGAVLSLFPIVIGAIGIIALTLSLRVALILGALVSGLGMALLILAVSSRDLLTYLLATAVAGGAYGLLFVGGLQVISAAAPVHHRGGILSALYLLGYLSMGAFALVLGAISTTRGAQSRRRSRCGSDHPNERRHACTHHDDAIHHIPFHRSSFMHVTITRTISLFQIEDDMTKHFETAAIPADSAPTLDYFLVSL